MSELDALRQQISKFSTDRDWDKFHSPKTWLPRFRSKPPNCWKFFQWLTDAEAIAAKENVELRTRSAEEIADIFIYLLRIADKMNIDIIDAAHSKLKINAQKYPVETSRGNARKYNKD